MAKNHFIPQLEIKKLTALAIGSGIGAALGYGLLPWYCLIPALLMLLLLPPAPRWRYAAALLICAGSGFLHKYLDDREKNLIPIHAGDLHGTVICQDKRLSAHPALPPPTVISCRIQTGDGNFDAAVIFPQDAPRPLYGNRWKFTGQILPATPAGIIFDGKQLAGKLPPVYGHRPLVKLHKIEPLSDHFSIFTVFFKLREKLLSRMLKYIDDPNVCSMAARMFFSASTGAPRELNRNFVLSGTVHLFSVSGIHVSILAGIIMVLLRFIPFTWRYRITALMILIYVMCTGASIPAIRAGFMIITWCLMRSMLFYAPTWNAMMLCWSIFAFTAPETVGNLGAQYSFGITAALILLMDKLQYLRQNDQMILNLMPSNAALTNRKRKYFRRLHKIRIILAVPIVAFVASCGLSLARQYLFVPGSILTNLLLPLFTPLLFPGLIFKLTAGAVFTAADRAGAWILTMSFHALSELVTFMAEYFPPIGAPAPPDWLVVIYYALLFIALTHQNHKWEIISIITIPVLLFLVPISKRSADGEILIVNHDATAPPLIAYLPPGAETALILNVPDIKTAQIAESLLRKSGTTQCRVGFSAGIRNHNNGLKYLARKLPCIVYRPVTKRKSSKAFQKNLLGENITVHDFPADFRLTQPHKETVIWHTIDRIDISASARDDGRQIIISSAEKVIAQATLPWCSLPVIWQIKIPSD